MNAPGEWPLRIVPRVHANGRMSRYLAEQLRPGDLIEVLPPNGSFTPRDPAAADEACRKAIEGFDRQMREGVEYSIMRANRDMVLPLVEQIDPNKHGIIDRDYDKEYPL